MNSRQLRLLSIVAVAVVAAAIWIGVARNPKSQVSEQNARLYPQLQGQLAKIQSIRIYKPAEHHENQPADEPARVLPEQTVAELARTASGWSVKQRNDYAADTQKVNALLLSIEGAKLREEKTSNPSNYAALGVQDLTVPGASGSRVELVGVDLVAPATNLIVGKSDAMTRASYVRRAGETKSWLTDEITVGTDIAAWLHRDLLNIGADRIQEVIVQLSDSPRYSAVKEKRADANFDVTPLPKKRELNSVSAANSVAQALTNLQLDDVRPIAGLGKVKSTAQASFHTFDGLIIDLSGYTLDDKHWIAVKASFDESLAKRFYLAAEAKDAKAENTPETANTKIQAEAETLNKQSALWAYAIAPYKYDAIFKPVEQLLKKPAEPLMKKP